MDSRLRVFSIKDQSNPRNQTARSAHRHSLPLDPCKKCGPVAQMGKSEPNQHKTPASSSNDTGRLLGAGKQTIYKGKTMADDKLAQLAQGKNTLGTGMLEQAKKKLTGRGYRLHVQEAVASGETPMSPEDWEKQQGK